MRSLTLITPFVEASPRLLAVLDAWCRIAYDASPETLAHALLPWLFSPRFLSDTAARQRSVRGLAAIAARVPATTLERAAAGLRAWSGSRRNHLKRLHLPTVVIAAGGDLLTADAPEVSGAITGARLEVIPDAGHAVSVEATDAVTAAILQHLGRP